MHICFITHGNIEKIATMKRATGMANYLLEYGHEVTIICSDLPENKERISFECPSVNVEWISANSAFDELKKKNICLKKINPDLVYVCSIGIRNWVRKNKSLKAYYIVEHSELPSIILDKSKTNRLKELIIEWASVFIFDAQICASRFLEYTFQTRMSKVGKNRPILYSPYAYNEDTLSIKNIPESKCLKNYEGKKVILYMGTLTRNYGFFDMLVSFNNLSKKRDDIILLIMGNGRHREEGIQYIKDNSLDDKIKMLGYVSEADLPHYFSRTDVFLSPLYDTLQDKARCPSKLFMYLPFQKPIVTCAVGEAYELFGHDGFYYEPGNVDSLEESLISALKHTGIAYPKMDLSLHSWRGRTGQFLNWINNIKENNNG